MKHDINKVGFVDKHLDSLLETKKDKCLSMKGLSTYIAETYDVEITPKYLTEQICKVKKRHKM